MLTDQCILGLSCGLAVALITPHTAVPLITGGCHCWHWYPNRLSVCLAGMEGGVVLWTREREGARESERVPLLLLLPPLSCAQRSGPAAPSFLISSPQLPLSSLGCWLVFSFHTPRRTRILRRVEGLTTCFAWSEFVEIRTPERRGVKREKEALHSPRKFILQ